ncbi:MAG: BON domain-containing protein [Myxococcota bacterium]
MTSTSSAAERVVRSAKPLLALVAGAALLLVAAWAQAQALEAGPPDTGASASDGAPPDAWITIKVKAALLTAQDVPSANVAVDTVEGLVTLHGSVGTAGEKANAEAAARSVQGMREVRNLLQVVPAPARAAVEVSDEALAKSVSAALARDAALADSEIVVESVNKGVVLLSGSAQSLSDHVRALEDASRVDGVKRVASQIKSPVQFVDSELWQDGEYELDLSERHAASDLWITTEVKSRLLAASYTPAYGINVDTRRGTVTLFGVVDSRHAGDAVVAETRKVQGVRGVEDALQIVPPEQEAAVAEQDEAVQSAIAKRFEASRPLADARIVVDVKNGVARLSGSVASRLDRLTVLTLTRKTRGVRGLVDELKVGGPELSAH